MHTQMVKGIAFRSAACSFPLLSMAGCQVSAAVDMQNVKWNTPEEIGVHFMFRALLKTPCCRGREVPCFCLLKVVGREALENEVVDT